MGSNIKKTIYRKFDKTLLEINLKYVLWSLSSILDPLVHCFYKILASWHKCMAKWDKKNCCAYRICEYFLHSCCAWRHFKKKKIQIQNWNKQESCKPSVLSYKHRNSNKLYNVYKIGTQLFFQASYTTMLSFTLSL